LPRRAVRRRHLIGGPSCPRQAIWWHVIVYDPIRSDNEELSAQLAEQAVTPNIRKEVGRLIRLAKSHQVATGDRLGAILISIDLSILDADPDRYDAYASSIRKEFPTSRMTLTDPAG
jgi:predicted metal-dependent HD superfamily phosphohydrolase